MSQAQKTFYIVDGVPIAIIVIFIAIIVVAVVAVAVVLVLVAAAAAATAAAAAVVVWLQLVGWKVGAAVKMAMAALAHPGQSEP